MSTSAKRVVVKVGTAVLTGADGLLETGNLRRIAEEIAGLHQAGHEILLVTSGAIGAGAARLGLRQRPGSLREKQACAAVGQTALMHLYEDTFKKAGILVGQVLLTREDLGDRDRSTNVRHTLLELLKRRVVPIINENDTVAVEEIKFGDNDTLAALVAGKVEAGLLILLTDVDGLMEDPDSTASYIIQEVPEITPEIEKLASPKPGSFRGTGGMATKITAAKIATASGVDVVITTGLVPGHWVRALDGTPRGTRFPAGKKSLSDKDHWLAFSATPAGQIIVDDGARRALAAQGRSLLPIGVTGIVGRFLAGDVVSVVDSTGKEIARGRVEFGADEMQRILGRQTTELAALLGRAVPGEVIHRDHLVLTGAA